MLEPADRIGERFQRVTVEIPIHTRRDNGIGRSRARHLNHGQNLFILA